MDFAHGYLPPGVYIEEDATPLVSTTGLPPTRLALVGRSVGYQVKTEQVTLGDTPVRLGSRGIDHSSVEVTQVADGSLVAATNYTLADVSGGSTATRDYYVDLTRAGSASVDAGTVVWVSYHYVTPDFYEPRLLDNFEDIKDAYGAPLNLVAQAAGDSGYTAINSPLTLAAQVALQNGAGEIVLVAIDADAGATSAQVRAALGKAYAKIATDYSVNLVVPLTDGVTEADAPGVALDLRSHVDSASADGYFRTGVVGFDTAVTSAPDTLINSGGFRSKRAMVAYASPGGLQLFNGNANQTVVVGHQYLATAYGARMSALPVQKSLTKEQILSFAGIAGSPLSNTVKNQYSSAGVAVTEIDRLGRMVVRHGTTTDRSSVNTAESSVVRARDAMVSLLQSGTEDSGMIGQPIDVNTPLSVKSVVAGLLEHCVSTGAIVAYDGLTVRQASVDPSVIEVKFTYKPAYPLNYVLISFSINVATGDTSLTDIAA